MKYVLRIRTNNTAETINNIHGILTGRSDGNEGRGGTVGTGFDSGDLTIGTGLEGGTGWYGQILTTGRDGRDRFCIRDRTVGAAFVDGTGR